MSQSSPLGKFAEQLAVDYLQGLDYTILARNFRYRHKEIDIVCLHQQMLVIVEVKARTNLFFGAPESFVGRRKIHNLVEATNAFMEQRQLQWEVRFDIIAVYFSKGKWHINHLPNAFLAL
ncbi:MAG: YraN family protein [Flavobacteriaceae bacterium]